MSAGEGIVDDDGGQLPPWGVVYNPLGDNWLAVCYPCDWRSLPADHFGGAVPDLHTHLDTEGHHRTAAPPS